MLQEIKPMIDYVSDPHFSLTEPSESISNNITQLTLYIICMRTLTWHLWIH